MGGESAAQLRPSKPGKECRYGLKQRGRMEKLLSLKPSPDLTRPGLPVREGLKRYRTVPECCFPPALLFRAGRGAEERGPCATDTSWPILLPSLEHWMEEFATGD